MVILSKYRVILSSLFVFMVSLIIFTISLPPSILFGDSGEFVTAAYFWGIPHPPGSPFWTFIAHFFTLLPINSVAWRVNFSSAFFGSLTIVVLAIFIQWLYKPKLQSIAIFFLLGTSVLIFAFTKSFWSQAVIAKYFTLNTLLFGFLLLSVYKYVETKKLVTLIYFFLLLD